jgi:N-acetylglucosaminyl-diphospho-decaprenol L-rhamnosyltransferase
LTALAVVVVTHQSRADLARFFSGQLETAARLDASVVVVDNASTDGGPELCRARAAGRDDLQVVRMGRNAGYAAAVNAGAAQAPGRDLLLVNPDIELADPAAVETLADVLAAHPRVAVAGPRLVGEDGSPQASARRFPSAAALLGTLPRLAGLGPVRRAVERYHSPSAATRTTTVDWVLGAAMLMRRSAFDEVRGWDERFHLYVEDVDFCRRLRAAGWKTAYVPEVELVHSYAKASDARRASALSSAVRRRHLAGHARLFIREPRLLFGLGRGRDGGLGP